MKKNILTIIIMASCLLNLILTAVIVFAVVPTMNKTSQLVDKVATAIDLETDEEDMQGCRCCRRKSISACVQAFICQNVLSAYQ